MSLGLRVNCEKKRRPSAAGFLPNAKNTQGFEMPHIYWTTIAASISLALWAVAFFNNMGSESSGWMMLFIFNLLALIIIREKTY